MPSNRYSPSIIPTIFNKTNIANSPETIPSGTPMHPSIIASYITLFLICFFVAPTELNIPYIFIFSVIAIANEFLMQNILVNIITPISIPHTVNSITTVSSEKANASHLSSSPFISYSYFNSSPFFMTL